MQLAASRRAAFAVLACVLLGGLHAAPAAAQSFSITGTVTDQAGAPISGATVFVSEARSDTARADSTSRASTFNVSDARTRTTGPGGRYAIDGLAPDRYAVRAYFTGKRLATRRVTVTDDDVQLDLTLSMLDARLEAVTVRAEAGDPLGPGRLEAIDREDVAIYEGKKSEVVRVDELTANLATSNSRQIYGKVAGLNIWESGPAGVQLGLGGRGLSPNRNANFNTRQNGYDIAADALGYPESYYTPPPQALQRVEIVRGAASLQYGTQFGGLVNFVFKDGPPDEAAELTTSQSAGSFGLLNSFNSVGGTVGPVNYYSYYQYKHTNGWRPNAGLHQHQAHASVEVALSDKITIRPEYTFMRYLAQQPGGLTDAQFARDPRQSNRARNWFRVNWNLFALDADYTLSDATRLNSRFFGLVAGRDALGNLKRIDRLDQGGPRNLLKDDFRNFGNETRVIHRYSLLGGTSTLLAGARYYQGFTHRRQGLGPAGDEPDFDYRDPSRLEGSDFDLPSRNVAVFVENVFNLTPRLSLTPGARFEYIRTQADGYYRKLVEDLAGNTLVDERIEEERDRNRSFVFFGLGASYKPSDALEIYANASQNYRAITFNDLRVNLGSLEVDPDLQDERGYNLDLGARGALGRLFNYEATLFYLAYQDRIGTVLRTEPNPRFNGLVDHTFRFRTNVADARIAGLESFAEVDLYKALVDRRSDVRLSVFSNLALISAEYTDSDEPGIEGNEVELVPTVNLKTGLTLGVAGLEVAYQFSYVGRQFSDATNARRTPTAIEGIIPAYHVMDLSVEYAFGRYRVGAGLNNLADERYFTRRATGYPGPGIIPATARNAYVTVGATL
jgi:Fe(3+) dicitrate transport protein